MVLESFNLDQKRIPEPSCYSLTYLSYAIPKSPVAKRTGWLAVLQFQISACAVLQFQISACAFVDLKNTISKVQDILNQVQFQ